IGIGFSAYQDTPNLLALNQIRALAKLYLLLRFSLPRRPSQSGEICAIAAYGVQYAVVSTEGTQNIAVMSWPLAGFDSKVGLVWAQQPRVRGILAVPVAAKLRIANAGRAALQRRVAL